MKTRIVLVFLLGISLFSCSQPKEAEKKETDVHIIGAMRQTMWNGELAPKVDFDTLPLTPGMYGLGPESYLRGEITLVNGELFVSRVVSDSTMEVMSEINTGAPFFVYSEVDELNLSQIEEPVHSLAELESVIAANINDKAAVKLVRIIGKAERASIHIQNLPEGTEVSSPEEAHQGQTNYEISNIDVELIGFYSTQHKGVFTHHDSDIHLHLISKDRSIMGHLDDIQMSSFNLQIAQ